ncbi:MAG: hypothetical protein WCF90_10465 [Methanomicrobiales archaeon]
MNEFQVVLDRQKRASLILLPVYLALIAIFLFFSIKAAFNPPVRLLVFNSLFLGLLPLCVTYILYRSFWGSGSNGILFQ